MASPNNSASPVRRVMLLGTRGLPAAHGGFETFLENLGPFLISKEWEVIVYCQRTGKGRTQIANYKGMRLVNIYSKIPGTLGTIIFDWKAMLHALRMPGILVSFGYPTGIFAILPRILRRTHIINMDGIEWKRDQFGVLGKIWYYLNERIAAYSANRLIADHPYIKDHLATRVPASKIEMIPYGAEEVRTGDDDILKEYKVKKNNYGIVIARVEKDNSILEIVKAFSARARNCKLIVLGNFDKKNSYHQAIKDAASEEVIFAGAIYDKKTVQSLRYFAKFYVHGHKVGGTNPSLVEALGVSSAVIARRNVFNEWVAKDAAIYFETVEDLDIKITRVIQDEELCLKMRSEASFRYRDKFTWSKVLSKYNFLLESLLEKDVKKIKNLFW